MPVSAPLLDLSGLPAWGPWLFAGLGVAVLFAVVLGRLDSGRGWTALVMAGVVAFVVWRATGRDEHPRAVLFGAGLFGFSAAAAVLFLGRLPDRADPDQVAAWSRRARATGYALGLFLVVVTIVAAVAVGGP